MYGSGDIMFTHSLAGLVASCGQQQNRLIVVVYLCYVITSVHVYVCAMSIASYGLMTLYVFYLLLNPDLDPDGMNSNKPHSIIYCTQTNYM